MKRLITGALALASGLVVFLLVVAADKPGIGEWPCKELMVIHGTVGEGDKTAEEALDRGVVLLANLAPGFPAEETEAKAALVSSSGDDRYESEGGRLFIDGLLAAEFRAERNQDGTYSVGNVVTCAPDQGDGLPTPEPGA